MSQPVTRVVGGGGARSAEDEVEEKKQNAISGLSTLLEAQEIAELKQYYNNSLAASTRKAYQSDYDSFVGFLRDRFPRLSIEKMHTQCTLEHVLAYLNALCNEGRRSARSTAGFRPSKSTSCPRCSVER